MYVLFIKSLPLYNLEKMLKNCEAGKIYVTAFPDFKEFKKHTPEIAWETEVWVADSPSHLIHFNGERFLGPYKVIEKTGTNSYKVRPVTSPDTDDPTDVHAERRIPFRPSDDADPAEMLASDRPLEYLVEEIRQHRRKRKGNTPGCFEYLVKWVGYDEVSWEPAKQFKNNSIFNNYLIANDIRR